MLLALAPLTYAPTTAPRPQVRAPALRMSVVPQHAAIIGGGPAGLLSAIMLAQRAAWPEGSAPRGVRSWPLVGLFAPAGGLSALLSSVSP